MSIGNNRKSGIMRTTRGRSLLWHLNMKYRNRVYTQGRPVRALGDA